MISVKNNYAVRNQEASTNEDIHISPRCSTPITNSRALYLPQEDQPRDKNRVKPSEYNEWKNSLERKKSSRIFKLRGTGDTEKYWFSKNCSMISGHLEPRFTDRISEETIVRPAPVYHRMWLPISSYPTLWNNGGPNQNPSWYKTPVNQPQNYYQSPPPVFGASGVTAAAFFEILNNANQHHHLHHYHYHSHNHNHNHNFHYGMQSQDYYTAKSQPMQYNANNLNYAVPMNTGHFYYQYHYPAQFFTYPSEIQRITNHLNVPFHGGNVFPVMMNS